MLGVLLIVFGRYRVARALRIARKLEIFFRNVRSRPADFHVRPVGLVHARQRILVMAALSVAATHSLILTVSHDLFSRQPLAATARMPPSRSQSPIVSRQFDARIRAVFFVHDSCDSTSSVPTTQPSPAALPQVANPHSAQHFVNARKTDEASRSESDDPVCRPIRRLLFPAFAVPALVFTRLRGQTSGSGAPGVRGCAARLFRADSVPAN